MRLAAIILLGLMFATAPMLAPGAAGAAEGWERLGTRTVNFGADLDRIVVGRDDGRFRELMFEVDGGAVTLYNVRVTFGNGQDYSPATELVFSDDERSRAIDLPGALRVIRSVDFNYRSMRTGQGRATITLYGR